VEQRLSACIITFNEAKRIEACLRCVSFCDEIVVVDAHSTDGTRELAAALGRGSSSATGRVTLAEAVRRRCGAPRLGVCASMPTSA